MPNTPLEPIKRLPYIGRLGRVFETEQGTGKVRVLIWEGAMELIGWHEPIGLPEREGPLNALRPLIGYGPESMYVAYNPFYPPDLAHYERRNASPDRSHNETFDALVQTGLIGFVVYFALFASIFYYGLKWLGLIEERRHTRLLFLGSPSVGRCWASLIPAAAGRNAQVYRRGYALWLYHRRGPLSDRLVLHGLAPEGPAGRAATVAHRAALGHRRALCRDPLWHRHRLHPHLLLGLCGAARRLGYGLGVSG